MRFVDSAWAVALMLLAAYTIADPPGPAYPGPTSVLWLVATLTALPLVARRRWPLTVLVIVLLSGTIATALGVAGAGMLLSQFLPTALALYTVGATQPTGRAVPALALTSAAVGAAIAVYYAIRLPPLLPSPPAEVPLWAPVEIAVSLVVMVLSWTIGVVVRWRRATSARLARSLAEAAVVNERLRIARDLHDIIGHSLSLISVKATVANHLADSRPEEVRPALAVIEQTSRTALHDVRRVLGVLREVGDDQPEPLGPAVGPANLAELAAAAAGAGVRVDLRLTGTDDLPEAVGLSAYRIAQEALTNVIRHAAPTTCRLTVEALDGELRIDVVDDGSRRRGGERHERGHGLLGMRERVTMYGGRLTAAPRPEGGFHVHAVLPLVERRT